MKKSPFAPTSLPNLPELDGVQLAACEAGIRYSGRKDLMLAVFTPQTQMGGVFTRSKTASAAVDWCRDKRDALLQGASAEDENHSARALVVNAGNANAFTGMRGRSAVEKTAQIAADAIGCKVEEVFIASTGVIGEALEPDNFAHHLQGLAQNCDATPDHWRDAAHAIMTTDTFAKIATRSVSLKSGTVRINGFAKGSGMIAPDMATMLAFFFTDAPISAAILQHLCAEAVERSFNAITVDSDTSTSDTVLLFATGAAKARGVKSIEALDDPGLAPFAEALDEIMLELAHAIVKDGEGASKFVEVKVCGAENDLAAKNIALAIANSPLVKTAFAGEDPNWGRVIMAVGKSGEAADRDLLSIWFGDIQVAQKGEVAPDYREELGADYMKQSELLLRVDVGIGSGEARVWTCDLTHDYISINADYRS